MILPRSYEAATTRPNVNCRNEFWWIIYRHRASQSIRIYRDYTANTAYRGLSTVRLFVTKLNRYGDRDRDKSFPFTHRAACCYYVLTISTISIQFPRISTVYLTKFLIFTADSASKSSSSSSFLIETLAGLSFSRLYVCLINSQFEHSLF